MFFYPKKKLNFSFSNLVSGNTVLRKLLIALIPTLIVFLLVTGFITYRFSLGFIETALTRNTQMQNLGQALMIEEYFEQCRQDLLLIAKSDFSAAQLQHFLRQRFEISGKKYPFVGVFSLRENAKNCAIVQYGDSLHAISRTQIASCRPDPFLFYENLHSFRKGEVWISSISEGTFPFPIRQNADYLFRQPVFFLVTPLFEKEKMSGYVVLAVALQKMYQIADKYNAKSVVERAYPRNSEQRFSFFFTPDGWILFEAGEKRGGKTGIKAEKDIFSTANMRGYCSGSMGLPGISKAFRPDFSCRFFWELVEKVKLGKHGVMENTTQKKLQPSPMIAYAPVFFRQQQGGKSKIIGGICFEDRSRLLVAAGYKQIDVMLLWVLAASFLLLLLVSLLSWYITRPFTLLTRAVQNLSVSEKSRPEFLEIPQTGYETSLLQDAINSMLATTYSQFEEIRLRDKKIAGEVLREPVPFSFDRRKTTSAVDRIIGEAPCMYALRSNILKAADTDVDILIVGETGTGKQLTAEAVHLCSGRQKKPFISINCGELDENLLLDTLFGHVKGAFTEARAERKGAFLEADGGTLFLDEIQVASARVQQALLRALALRKIRPLGSDREFSVDVRIIAASNVDLRHLVRAKLFRNDLYFRLRVITVQTPPLREHKDDILETAMECLFESEELTGKGNRMLSKGALEKMREYDWPGNVRELRNCIIRAAVMHEDEILQAEHIVLENDLLVEGQAEQEKIPFEKAASSERVQKEMQNQDKAKSQEVSEQKSFVFSKPESSSDADLKRPANRNFAAEKKLNLPQNAALEAKQKRQEMAWAKMQAVESFNRSDYEEFVGKTIAPRTAVYDLQEMVEKGLLSKTGTGRATRYAVVKTAASLINAEKS